MKLLFSFILYILILPLFFVQCKNVLDIGPENIIQDEDLFSDESGVDAYLASLYNDMPIEDFNLQPAGGYFCHISGEALNCAADDKNHIGNGTSLQWFRYDAVRNVNNFLLKLPAYPFDEAKKKHWLGEARFIRAYYYFALVKRYGGMPLITEPQHFDGTNLEVLKVPRNKEKELWDFVGKELDTASRLLNPVSVRGRANKYTAYALKSRAMLYAASIAKYGTVQLGGILGIPMAEANDYWQQAYDAAKMVMDSKQYSLYNKQPDKTENFIALFLDANNPEAVLTKVFKYPEKGHSYDRNVLPFGVRSAEGYGGRVGPTLEAVEQFEYIDDDDGRLRLTDQAGNPVRYTNPLDLFAGKDPRLAATVIFPFDQWKGTVIDVQAGLIHRGVTITTNNYNSKYDSVTKTIGNTGFQIIGLNGLGGGTELSLSGFHVRKYLNPQLTPSTALTNYSDQQYIDIRYAEVLLNYAEAAVELGKIPDAKTAINLVRGRAGIRLLDDGEVTRNRVRRERMNELAFESHRYWDLRRWRIGESVISNTRFTALQPFKVLEDNTFIFRAAKVGLPKTWETKINYERIEPGEITKNPKLVQNPLY